MNVEPTPWDGQPDGTPGRSWGESEHSESRGVPESPENSVSNPESSPGETGPAAHGDAELGRIAELPKEVGVMLMTVGVLGLLLPGVVGAPAFLAGGLVLWPKSFRKLESWFAGHWPDLHRKSLYQIDRYLNDLENRYPNDTRSDHPRPDR
jgi:hypothetical protein